MPDDDVLCGLLDQNSLAREAYYIRKRQELSPSKQGLTALDQRERTEAAKAAWETTEAALWRHMASRKNT